MDLTALSEFARPLWTIWLMAVFIAIVTWAYWPRNKTRFEQDAQIVFDDEKNGD